MNTRKAVAVSVALAFSLGNVLSAQARKSAFPIVPVGPEVSRSLRAVPPEAQLDRFPIEPGVLTSGEIVRLGLRITKLDTSWTGFNWYRNVRGGRFVFETIPAHTEVLVDSTGTPRYRRDCGNRLVELAKCPDCVKSALFGGGLAPKLGDGVGNQTPTPLAPVSRPSALRRLSEALSDVATGLWKGLGDIGLSLLWLALILLALILLPLLAYYLYRLWRGRGRSTSSGSSPRSSARPPSSEVASGGGVRIPPDVVPPVTTGTSRAGESSKLESSGPAVATATVPTPAPANTRQAAATGRRFISFEPADDKQPHMIRFSGFHTVNYEEQHGITTLRFNSNA